MNKNIFEEFQAKKQQLIETAHLACKNGWIDSEREKEIIDKINNDVLTLGVIGQMKCGKSTFLNAFVFGDTVLPSATTPMTAALSVITYGEAKKLVAEFYTPDEWAEQKSQAARSLDMVAGNAMEESKVKAAKELVSKAANLPGPIESYLGKTQNDTFNNLEQYVGAAGKYVAITKSVTIYYPHDYLKGVEIVDTPGFNDPIVSREERTKEFLKKADVVLLMLYAGRAFDITDRSILFKNVRQCGIGKILIGVNKYDIPYGNGETEGEIIANVKEQIGKACAACGDDTMSALVTEHDPILLSAEMSLLSQLPMSVIQNSDSFRTTWRNACDNFEISSQVEMAAKSRIKYLTEAIRQVIERDKMEVLLKKPTNAIKAAADKQREDIERELRETESLIDNLQQPDDELEERKRNLQKAERRMSRKIDYLGDDIEDSFRNIVRKGNNEMEDAVDSVADRMKRIVDDKGCFEGPENTIQKLEAERNKLIQRGLQRIFKELCKEAESRLIGSVGDFCAEVEDVLLRYVEDFDAKDFGRKIKKFVQLEADKGLFALEKESSDSEDYGFGDFVVDMLGMPFKAYFGIFEVGYNALNHGDIKRELKESIEDMRSSFDASDFLNRLLEKKDEIIDDVKRAIIDELLVPMQQQIDEILNNVNDKDKALTEANAKREVLVSRLADFSKQYSQVFPA